MVDLQFHDIAHLYRQGVDILRGDIYLVAHLVAEGDDGVLQGCLVKTAFLIVVVVHVWLKDANLEVVLLILLEEGVAVEVFHLPVHGCFNDRHLHVFLSHDRHGDGFRTEVVVGSDLMDVELHRGAVGEYQLAMAFEERLLIAHVPGIPKGVACLGLLDVGEVNDAQVMEYAFLVEGRVVLEGHAAHPIAKGRQHGAELARLRVGLDIDVSHRVGVATGAPRLAFHKFSEALHGDVLRVVDNLRHQPVVTRHHIEAALRVIDGLELQGGLSDGVLAHTVSQGLDALDGAAGDAPAKMRQGVVGEIDGLFLAELVSGARC